MTELTPNPPNFKIPAKGYRVTPSPEGAELGRHMARFADQGEPKIRLLDPTAPPRCTTCAFRLGTKPNSYAETLMTATKCMMEKTPFHCHERKDECGDDAICMGWLFAMGPPPWPEPIAAPWDFPEPFDKGGPR